ncbi:MAG TPA: hypothetical protein VE077_21775, partial [Candidatus Methylomirabilis sp.]|nr:hypothetical protein [Candidatus Methylomirabilis sp.]
VQMIIIEIRDIRAKQKLDPRKPLKVEFWTAEAALRDAVAANRTLIEKLASLSSFENAVNKISTAGGFFRSTPNFDIKVIYESSGDVEAEKARLLKEYEGLRKSVLSKKQQLGNDTFRARAPEAVVRKMEKELLEQITEMQKIDGRFTELGMKPAGDAAAGNS